MSKKTYENLKETLEYELDGLVKKGDINKDTLDSMYKLIKSIKGLGDLTKEDGMDMGYSQNYSRDYSRNMPMNSYAPIWNTGYDPMRGMSNGHENSYEMGNSNANNPDRASYDGNSNARKGRDGDGDGRYSEDSSYRRGRDARGRYTSRDNMSRDGYSRHSAKDRVIQRLETMLDESPSQSEQIAIMKCIEELQD